MVVHFNLPIDYNNPPDYGEVPHCNLPYSLPVRSGCYAIPDIPPTLFSLYGMIEGRSIGSDIVPIEIGVNLIFGKTITHYIIQQFEKYYLICTSYYADEEERYIKEDWSSHVLEESTLPETDSPFSVTVSKWDIGSDFPILTLNSVIVGTKQNIFRRQEGKMRFYKVRKGGIRKLVVHFSAKGKREEILVYDIGD